MSASYSELHDAEPIAASTTCVTLVSPSSHSGIARVATVRGSARIGASPSAPISEAILPAVDMQTLRLSQSVCDRRFARCAASAGIDITCVTVHQAGEPADEATALRDPAVLTISFSMPALRIERVDTLIELDLDEYPSLRIALGSGHIDATSTSPDTAAAKRRQELTLGVAGVLIEPLLAHLSALHLDNPRLTGITRGHIPETWQGPLVHLVLSPRDANEASVKSRVAFRHVVAFPEDAIECIDAIVQSTPFDLEFGKTPMPGSALIGSKRLSIDTLNRLQPGDVLLRALFPSFDAQFLSWANEPHDASDDARSGEITADIVAAWGTPGLLRLRGVARFDGISAVITKESYMSDQLEPAFDDVGLAVDQQGDPVHIGDLELPVQFEIDTLAIPLSQLSSIGPGYVIEFPVPFRDAKLRLVAHGNTIGHGELVTVGEHLGVRIVRMAHNNNALPETEDGSI